ncbi:hypothetical protein NL676_038737 [Syzygium grande]|nr:hypothetical protein NL676_038737 [Syzygium grande]
MKMNSDLVGNWKDHHPCLLRALARNLRIRRLRREPKEKGSDGPHASSSSDVAAARPETVPGGAGNLHVPTWKLLDTRVGPTGRGESSSASPLDGVGRDV